MQNVLAYWPCITLAAPDGCIVALNGAAGYQADTLAPGLHVVESGNYAMVQVAEAPARAGVKLMPDIVAGVLTRGERLQQFTK